MEGPLDRYLRWVARMRRRGWIGWLAVALALATFLPASAQTAAARRLITEPVDEGRLSRLPGNVRPEANARNDRGPVPDALPMQHMQLLLKRPAEREQSVQEYIAQLHDRRSPNYHRWLTANQFAQWFGVAQADLDMITGWLQRHGFTVDTVYPGSMIIDFTGTAGQVRTTFHSKIHALDVRGVRHIANMSDPQIPAALAPVVTGIVSLHDFRPRTMQTPRTQYSTSGGSTLVAPADLATIYNLNPVFAAGNTGQNQTIVVIEDSDVYQTSDWSTFRSTFGLSAYTAGSFTQVHPASPGGHNCADPGVVADIAGEAILDAEWASAAAPGAAIELASCRDSGSTFGGLIALENILNATTPPAIVSISYGECEASNGAAANAVYNSTYQLAVVEGVSVFVAAGDDGAATCDPRAAYATHGIDVNGFASTPYDVAVGGTDFGDTYSGTVGSYWSTSNSTTYESARSYIPEIPWNDSCAGTLLTTIEGYGVSYGAGGFCNSATGAGYVSTIAGGGGPSACATGSPSQNGVVGGSCAGAPKPSWQLGAGTPSDGVRDLPDVALFAGNGLWGHYYVYCWSDTSTTGGKACTGAPSGWSGAGGTSFAAPILAGIQALVNKSTGTRQGNPNYVYYALAASQRASGMNCNSSTGNAASNSCVFYDVTLGDMDVVCAGSNNCYRPAGTYGVLSTSSGGNLQAFVATTGWDFATGLGSVNAANLVSGWTSSDLVLGGSGSVTLSGQLSYTLTIGNNGPQTATGVTVTATFGSGMSLVSGSSSSGCSQSGLLVTCTLASLSDGATATLVVVIQPGAAATANVSFHAQSANGDIDSVNNVYSVALNLPGDTGGDSDGPVSPWAIVLLGLALFSLASQRRRLNAPSLRD